MNKPKVVISKCPNYHQATVDQTIHQTLAQLGGIEHFVKQGQKVLIKPNVLIGLPPDNAATTHPSIISAVVKEVVKAGGIALVGDSPGNSYGNVEAAMVTTGIKPATEEAGGSMIYFQQSGIVEIESPSNNQLMKTIRLAKPVLEADVVINLPKLKTHTLTLFTGAIKNMFGTVPGFYKTKFHSAAPHPRDFAALIVDVFEATKPTLTIMDAVIGMEGKGPTDGTPRAMGAIVASVDSVAVDAVCASLIGFKPEEIIITRLAHQRKLGELDFNKLELIGTCLDELRQPRWDKPFGLYQKIKWLPKVFYNLLTPIIDQLKVNPLIDQTICEKCLICVNNCPESTIKQDPKSKAVIIDLKRCINCFCCHELCPYKAIKLERNWLIKLLGI